VAGSNLNRADLIALLGIVNDTEILPAKAELDSLGSKDPSASVQQLDGSRMIETYVDGSGVAENPFAVLVRCKPADSKGRAAVAGQLMDLAETLEAMTRLGQLPEGWRKISGLSTPTLTERDGNGSEVWRASFVLESARSAPALLSEES
jgi:hypothetical protein